MKFTVHCIYEFPMEQGKLYSDLDPIFGLCGAQVQFYTDGYDAEWLLANTADCIENFQVNHRLQLEAFIYRSIEFVPCEECKKHPDYPLLVLGQL